MNTNEKLNLLRNIMSRHNIDAYIVPTCDFHGSEYVGDYFKTREYITGFTGSAGTAVITADKALLWTDGRYFIQAQQQLEGSEFVLMKSGEPGVPAIEEYLADSPEKGSVIGFDGKCMPANEVKKLLGDSDFRVSCENDLIGEIWTDRPSIFFGEIRRLDAEYAGVTRFEKLWDIREQMRCKNQQVLVMTSLDEIAWTLNLRGCDITYNPVFMSFLVITQGECILFAKKEKTPQGLAAEYDMCIKDYDDIYDYISRIRDCRIWIDESTANYHLVNLIDESNSILDEFTPAFFMKAVKNDVEIRNMRKAHLMDGVAMTKFIYRLKKEAGKVPMSEVSVGEMLEEFRGESESYIEPSFEPIVGYKDHGAIVHYSATAETDYDIAGENIVLIDSGGHYNEGTTDITRTISLGPVTDRMREMYTAVLRGNLNLAAATFKQGCTGVALDYLARKPLWDKGLDYNHGTGHGVGYLLNVHEQPNAFCYRIMNNPVLNAELMPGMVTSDEPGVYLESEFGIRLENLILCVEKEQNEYGQFLGFETLTLVPWDRELIDVKQMSKEEVKLLNEYNRIVYEKISPYLEENEREWLKEECRKWQ